VKLENVTSLLKCPRIRGLRITLLFHHNSTDGILSAHSYVQLTNSSLLETTVRFAWLDQDFPNFVRSGNPGYINGKPVLAGVKVKLDANDTSSLKREAIQLSVDPRYWLTVPSTEKGVCLKDKRDSVLFNENLKRSCVLKVTFANFSKIGCAELQSEIFRILLNESRSNLTQSSFNRYLGIFGNSRVNNFPPDWVEILIDSFPVISTSPAFVNSSNTLKCKSIFTEVVLDIATSKFGSFKSPQTKILGGLVRFSPPIDVSLPCMMNVCYSKDVFIRLAYSVYFYDLSRPAVREFAQPPGLEAKLPHDFFYPFFSHSGSVKFFMSPSYTFLLLGTNFLLLTF